MALQNEISLTRDPVAIRSQVRKKGGGRFTTLRSIGSTVLFIGGDLLLCMIRVLLSHKGKRRKKDRQGAYKRQCANARNGRNARLGASAQFISTGKF